VTRAAFLVTAPCSGVVDQEQQVHVVEEAEIGIGGSHFANSAQPSAALLAA
jgi:hypothetical protein